MTGETMSGYLKTLNGYRNSDEGRNFAEQIEARHAGGQQFVAQTLAEKPKLQTPGL